MMQHFISDDKQPNHSLFKAKWITLNQFNLMVSLWLSLGLNLHFFQSLSQLTPYHGLKHGLFILSSVILVSALYCLFFQILHWHFNAKLLSIVWLIIGGLSAYFVNRLGIIISPDQIQNMLQTDRHEVFDLISLDLLLWIAGMIILPMVLILYTQILPATLTETLKSKFVYSVTALMLIGTISYSFYIDYAAIFREHRELKGFLSPQNAIGSAWSYYRAHRPKKNQPLLNYGQDAHQIQSASLHQKPKLMVLVVGETARAESFSLNGYVRPTNPELSKQALINFTRVSSCGTATAVSVPCIFSGMSRNQYNQEVAQHRENLLDIAQRAGYQVTWIDNNSGCKEVCNRVQQYKIPQSIQSKWCTVEDECSDDILIDSLKSYLKHIPQSEHRPQLIVLHQMGSHGPAYYKRSTPMFKPFQPECESSNIQGCSRQALINSYDNSIVYTDHVLNELIELLKQQSSHIPAFWYLSDHGESTGEHGLYLHGAPFAIAPTQQTHVPMLIWFSPIWNKHFPHDENCLNRSKNLSISQDNLFPTLLHLMGVQTQTIQPQLDLLNSCQTSHQSG